MGPLKSTVPEVNVPPAPPPGGPAFMLEAPGTVSYGKSGSEQKYYRIRFHVAILVLRWKPVAHIFRQIFFFASIICRIHIEITAQMPQYCERRILVQFTA